MNNSKHVHNNELMIDTNRLSNLFRIEKLSIERAERNAYIYKATLYSRALTLKVTWLEDDKRKDISYGVLVRGVWFTQSIFAVGTNIIKSVQKAQKIDADECLSTTVMNNWIYDGFTFGFIFDQIEVLPFAYRQLITQILRDHFVLYHFLKAPITLEGNNSNLGSCFQNTANLLGFVIESIKAKKINGPREVFITAAILLGIGQYNQFEFDHQSQSYHPYHLTNAHEPKIVAIGLINKAIDKDRGITIDVSNQVIDVIENLEFEC